MEWSQRDGKADDLWFDSRHRFITHVQRVVFLFCFVVAVVIAAAAAAAAVSVVLFVCFVFLVK